MSKISSKQIVCPAFVWEHFFENTKRGDCGKVICCYSCSRQGQCTKNGCSRGTAMNSPQECKVYPLTFEEAKIILFYYRLLENEEANWGYVKYSWLVEEYLRREKRIAQKEKSKRQN